MNKRQGNGLRMVGAAALCAAVIAGSGGAAFAEHQRGRWLAGDFHNHTFLTDGSNLQSEVLEHAFQFGLDWIANSEHGGAYNRNTQGLAWPADTEFLGNPPAGKMWRWQSLWQYSFPIISAARSSWPDKLIVQGYEWNVPTHEHASVAIVGPAEQGGKAIAQHEYLFDGSDSGTTSDGYLGVSGKLANSHEKAVAGAVWLEDNFPKASYFLLNHPSRALKYTIADIRDFNNAAPDVAFGFEGIPGHQKESARGGYSGSSELARTYGGADYMIARVGGLWDALLGEGRHFYTFVDSDFHSTGGDFWPGEYAKSYTFAPDEDCDGSISSRELLDGLRSGNSFAVHGDLINALQFTARANDGRSFAEQERHREKRRLRVHEREAAMGGELQLNKGGDVTLKIRFRSPAMNNNGDPVAVDHIDLIAGAVTGKVGRYLADGVTLNPAYDKDTNESTKVIATFTRGDFEKDDDGFLTVTYRLKNVKNAMYFRLRGTNLPPNTPNETDAAGNPLIDDLVGPNTAAKAYADLWFYSNPIFVTVSR